VSDLQARPPELARMFDRVAREYDARPDYPDRVFELLAETCGLGPGTRVLEIGAGTGKATLPLLARGATITAVEPGPALAEVLRASAAGQPLDVIVSRFEDAELPAASFDLVAAGTAYHWVDPYVGVARIADALRDGGHAALWWTVWGDPDRPDPFRVAFEPVLAEKAPQLVEAHATHETYVRDLDARMALFDAAAEFGAVERTVVRWEGVHDPAGLRRVFATFAGWIAMPEPLRTELLGDVERVARQQFGNTVRRPYQTRLYVVPRRPRPA
jgi:SAM-dependent methyltransferase